MKNNIIGLKSIKAHKKLNGKVTVISKVPLKSMADLSLYYTPGVGAVAFYLAANKNKVHEMTIKKNSIAIISDGSAVLGLGNIGPEGAIPVMEGKAMIFKEFANLDAYPIVLDTQDTEEIIKTVKNIAPIFGGINLEDIAAPRCFKIEDELVKILDIPVIHDDQHGAAVAVLAGLINALKIVKKDFRKIKVVIIGAGAAGNSIAKILVNYGIKNILILDSKSIISTARGDLDFYKMELAKITNPGNISGDLDQAMIGADLVIGVSKAGVLEPKHILSMNQKPIVFSLSNPIPEIMPDLAKKAGAFIVATGRSDFENQINNSLVFPGLLRGALDNRVKKITYAMKIAAAKKLASLVVKPTVHKIIPSIFDKGVVKAVASAVKN